MPEKNGIEVMNSERRRSWEGMLHAAMNLEYHRFMFSWTEIAETSLKVICFLFVTSAAVASLPVWEGPVGEIVKSVVTFLAALCAALNIFVPFKSYLDEHKRLIDEWAKLEAKWKSCYRDVSRGIDTDPGIIDSLESEQTLIEAKLTRKPWTSILAMSHRQVIRHYSPESNRAAA